jgi:ribosomal protein S18 acetylase RimI-like enzyme
MIFELTEHDLDNVIKLGTELNYNFPNLYTYESLNLGVNKTFILKNNNTLIGFIHVQDLDDDVSIINVIVKKEFRHLGYGDKLIKYVIEKYINKRIILEVSNDNKSAINLYIKNNFAQIGIRKGYYDGIDAIVMERK